MGHQTKARGPNQARHTPLTGPPTPLPPTTWTGNPQKSSWPIFLNCFLENNNMSAFGILLFIEHAHLDRHKSWLVLLLMLLL